jgi:N-acetylglutamate synthase/N-acetylornithine aminotransferase
MEYDDNQSTSVINKDENMSNSKNDRTEHKKVANFSKSEKQYLKGMVNNLSLQRLTDGEGSRKVVFRTA